MQNFKKLLLIIFTGIIALSLTACGTKDKENNSSSVKSKDKLEIKTTVYPLKSFANQIGGKYVDVKSVYPKGMDPHTYDPSQKDMISIGKSDLFIYTGDNLDPVAKKISKSIDNKDKTLSLESNLNTKSDLLKGEEHEHEHGEEHEHHDHGKYDPHVWLDPVLSQKFAKDIKNELVSKDKKHKDYYEKNYKKLNKELKEIDNDMKKAVKGHEGETVYISHDSIGYLADRYNFKQEGIENMSAEEPSQKDITNIAKDIKKKNIKHVLTEENVSKKITNTVINDTNAKTIDF
ncbi:metal ABC transporter solute-binding protein, Zn/Mn family, partial [Staphylococcus devriesei]